MPNDNKFTPADFDPILKKYDGIPYLRFWCQKVLPAVYDQSLSYYEVLCKLAAFLNKMLEELEKMQDNIDALHKAYKDLQDWVNAEIARFEAHMEQHFDDLTKELWNKFEQYKNDTNTTLQQWFNEYATNTTNNLNKKFNEFVTNANTRIDQMFKTYTTNTNNDFNTWKTDFTNQYNQWKADVDEQITNINSNISSLTARVTELENMIKKYPDFNYKTFTMTGTKYYKQVILDMVSFPSAGDSTIICYGVCRVYGQDSSVAVSGNWRERLVPPANFKKNLTELLGATNQNTFKFELMPRTSYVSDSGDENNGAPTSDKLIAGLLWTPGPGDNSGSVSSQLFFKNNGSVGFVSDNSMLFSAVASQQVNPPQWEHQSGEWTL
jgi:archaellum component FlaC|nr:MAG TPA: Dynamin-like helical domain [Caudoviricetes sp.]